MPQLLSLPNELLVQIINWCTPADSRALRYVSPRLAHAAAPALFNDFHLRCFESSVVKLQSLSTSPIAKYVRHLTLHTAALHNGEPDLDATQFEERLRAYLEDRWTSPWRLGPFLPPAEQWPEVRLTLLESCRQNSWFFSEEGQRTLRSTLDQLPTLQRISLTTDDRDEDMIPWHPTMISALFASLLCKAVGLEIEEAKIHDILDVISTTGQGAIRAAPARGEEQRIDRSAVNYGLSQPTHRADTIGALGRINTFEHMFYSEKATDEQHLDILNSCGQLRDLRIHCRPFEFGNAHPSTRVKPLSGMLKAGLPSSLTRLSMSEAHLLGNEFCLFLSDQAESLTGLTIANTWFDDCRRIFRHIACSLRLREVALTRLSDPSCFDQPELPLAKVFFQFGLESEPDVLAWLLGERREEPSLQLRSYMIDDGFPTGSCLDDDSEWDSDDNPRD